MTLPFWIYLNMAIPETQVDEIIYRSLLVKKSGSGTG